MLIDNIKEFKKKTHEKKILCLDCGKKKVGLAISDENHKIATPMKTIIRNKDFHKNLKIVINDFEIGGVLVGIPIRENKKINKTSQSILDITKNLDFYLFDNNIELPIFFWDENNTSIEAEDLTYNFFKNKKKQKKSLDKFAAKVILDDFLNFNSISNEKED
jgi:putative Holliday junction resolvase